MSIVSEEESYHDLIETGCKLPWEDVRMRLVTYAGELLHVLLVNRNDPSLVCHNWLTQLEAGVR